MTKQAKKRPAKQAKRLYFPPLLQCLLFGVAGFALARSMPTLEFRSAILVWVSIVLAMAGLLILLFSVRSFGEAGTTVNPIEPNKADQLVTSGLYRFTRNPMYLGMLLMLLGGALGLQNTAALSAPILFAFSITCFQIIPEERALVRNFGRAFSDYCKQTRRWI